MVDHRDEAAAVVGDPAHRLDALGDVEDRADAGRHLVRWAFCKDAAVIEEGLRRLAGADLSAR